MTRWLAPLLALLMTGCLGTVYEAATDERSLGTQAEDAKISTSIRTSLLNTNTKALSALDVFCYQSLVVIAGVVEPGSPLGDQAVRIARGTSGVKRVETYFLPQQPSATTDFGIASQIKGRILKDPALRLGQVDVSVIAGHVVLVGVVDRQEKINQVIAHARSVPGVVTVKSFIQVKRA